MRTNLFFAALASVMLVGCTSNDFVGDTPPATSQDVNEAAINFNSGTTALTRADLYGSSAAEKLGNAFVVYGTKHAAAETAAATNDAIVFNNFQVNWAEQTAGTTASNSSDWEYVGKDAYESTVTKQTIKYWDYSAAQGYTFYAFSSNDISYPAESTDKVSISKVTADASSPGSLYNKGYSVTVNSAGLTDAARNDILNKLYFSDRKPVAKGEYGKTVSLTFRNIASKVRVGFYETIPGYSVTIDKFYIDNDAAAAVTTFPAMNNAKEDGYFYASLQNVDRAKDQTLNVTYYDATDPTIENRPKFSNPSAKYAYTLKLGAGSGLIGTTLGTDASDPTWDNEGNYTAIFPFEDNTNPLLLKLDFTLTSEDGQNEVIHVRGARAIVPVQYVKWKSNFAYTYIFKISDKSNGTTGNVDVNDDPTDPEGLTAITFDAIVVDVDDNKQETITSVSSNSITTYAKGAIVNEYNKNEPIYVTVTTTANSSQSVITPGGIGDTAGKAQVYKLNKATTEAAVLAKLNGLPGDFTMTATTGTEEASVETTIPLADGTNPAISNVKFTPSAAGYYAYVYTTTKYVAPQYTNQSSGTYDSSKTYYMKTADDVYYAVSVPTQAAFDEHKAQLYLIDTTNAGTPGVYDVKVIKVQ